MESTAQAPVFAPHAIAATGHPFATAAALHVLAEGGNAVDAALAASAVLCVVMPQMTGIGGDGFAQVAGPTGPPQAYNSGGTAGSGATPSRYTAGVDRDGLRSACIPGLPDLWERLQQDHATQPLSQLFAPAIILAQEGFPISADVAQMIATHAARLARDPTTAAIFLPGGQPPAPGQRLRQPQLAATLHAFAEGGRDAFYGGAVGTGLAEAFAAEAAGVITAEDLINHSAEAVDPLLALYRDHTIYEQPPISQGHLLLQELLLIANYELAALGHLSAQAIHTLVEAKKLAFADRRAAAGDPRFVDVDWDALLSPERAAARAQDIDPEFASDVPGADSQPTDTTQFAVGDAEGRAVTFIQSVYHPFGCATVAGDTGIMLNNRMLGFNPNSGHPNGMAPGKRTLHTLNTYTVYREGRLLVAGGTPGGDFQVQTNLQVLTGIIDYGLDLQQAVDAPRWGHTLGRELLVEARIPAEARRDLRRRGHVLRVIDALAPELGCTQLIGRLPESGWQGASDPRREGAVLGF